VSLPSVLMLLCQLLIFEQEDEVPILPDRVLSERCSQAIYLRDAKSLKRHPLE
jgi:hypothetical protein